jgi:hypothetical protein
MLDQPLLATQHRSPVKLPQRPMFAVRDGAGYRDISAAEFARSVHRVAAGLIAARRRAR